MDRPQVKGSSQKPDAEPAALNRCTTHLNFNFLLCNRVLPRWLISLHPLLKRLHKGWCVCGSAALEPRVGTHGGDGRASWSEFSIIEAFLFFSFFFIIFRFQNSEFWPTHFETHGWKFLPSFADRGDSPITLFLFSRRSQLKKRWPACFTGARSLCAYATIAANEEVNQAACSKKRFRLPISTNVWTNRHRRLISLIFWFCIFQPSISARFQQSRW